MAATRAATKQADQEATKTAAAQTKKRKRSVAQSQVDAEKGPQVKKQKKSGAAKKSSEEDESSKVVETMTKKIVSSIASKVGVEQVEEAKSSKQRKMKTKKTVSTVASEAADKKGGKTKSSSEELEEKEGEKKTPAKKTKECSPSSTVQKTKQSETTTTDNKPQDIDNPMGAFSKLPGELRNKIYNYTFYEQSYMPRQITITVSLNGSESTDNTKVDSIPRRATGLFSTCRQIRAELPPLYRDAEFRGYVRNYTSVLREILKKTAQRNGQHGPMSGKLTVKFDKDLPYGKKHGDVSRVKAAIIPSGFDDDVVRGLRWFVQEQRACFEEAEDSTVAFLVARERGALHLTVISAQSVKERKKDLEAQIKQLSDRIAAKKVATTTGNGGKGRSKKEKEEVRCLKAALTRVSNELPRN